MHWLKCWLFIWGLHEKYFLVLKNVNQTWTSHCFKQTKSIIYFLKEKCRIPVCSEAENPLCQNQPVWPIPGLPCLPESSCNLLYCLSTQKLKILLVFQLPHVSRADWKSYLLKDVSCPHIRKRTSFTRYRNKTEFIKIWAQFLHPAGECQIFFMRAMHIRDHLQRGAGMELTSLESELCFSTWPMEF